MNLNASSRRLESTVLIVLCIMTSAIWWSCGSSEVVQNLSAEDRYGLGMKKFDQGNYVEAISEFEIVRLQFPGSTVADKAQFYLAESHFKQEEYLIAAEEFQALKRNMSASPLVPLAQYKIGLCYYNLSPVGPLDEASTLRAIDEFQTFIEYYPTNEFVKDAEAKIKELNTRKAKKLYNAAELYMKMEYYKAAIIYFNNVIEKYHDIEYAEPALLGKVKALVARKKYDEARPEVEKFLEKYPQSKLKGEAESLQRDINDHVKSKSAEIGKSAALSRFG